MPWRDPIGESLLTRWLLILAALAFLTIIVLLPLVIVFEEALKKNNIIYELYIYEGANHAFHNDTAPTRYNEAAAKLAWQRTIDFFGKYVK